MTLQDRLKLEHFKINYLSRTKRISKETAEKMKLEMKEWLFDIAEIQKASRRKKTIRDNIFRKKLNWYVTFTLKGSLHDKNELLVKKNLTQLLRRYNIQYVLVPEYQEKGAIHFHGFIDVPDLSLIKRKVINGKDISNKYGDDVYEFIPLEKNLGFTDLIDINDKDINSVNKIINYIVKYLTKEGSKIMSSRLPKNSLDLAIHFFGVDIVEIK